MILPLEGCQSLSNRKLREMNCRNCRGWDSQPNDWDLEGGVMCEVFEGGGVQTLDLKGYMLRWGRPLCLGDCECFPTVTQQAEVTCTSCLGFGSSF